MRVLLASIVAVLSVAPAAVLAQSPTSPAHPALPWGLGPAIPQGQLLRYAPTLAGSYVRDIWIPAQEVVVDARVALSAPPVAVRAADAADDEPAAAEPQYGVLRHTFVVPGYYVRETTVGFHYPERWVLDQSYTWQLLPAEFRPRSTVWNPGWPPAPATVPTLGSAGAPAAPLVTPSIGNR